MVTFFSHSQKRWILIAVLLVLSIYVFGGLRGFLDTLISPDFLGGVRIVNVFALAGMGLALATYTGQYP